MLAVRGWPASTGRWRPGRPSSRWVRVHGALSSVVGSTSFCRPARARPIVIGSANSRSPPWGTPLAMRVTRRRAARAPASAAAPSPRRRRSAASPRSPRSPRPPGCARPGARSAAPRGRSPRAARAACPSTKYRPRIEPARSMAMRSCTRADDAQQLRVALAVRAHVAHAPGAVADLGDVAAALARPHARRAAPRARPRGPARATRRPSAARGRSAAPSSPPRPAGATKSFTESRDLRGSRCFQRARAPASAMPGDLHAAGDLLELRFHRLVGLLDAPALARRRRRRARARCPRSSGSPGRSRCASRLRPQRDGDLHLAAEALAVSSLSLSSVFACSILRCMRAAWRISSFIPPRNCMVPF